MSVHIPIVLHASPSPPIKTRYTHIHGDACMLASYASNFDEEECTVINK